MLKKRHPASLLFGIFTLVFWPFAANAADGTTEGDWIFFWGGFLFMLVYAVNKFNMWTDEDENKTGIPPRHFTTWARFFRYACLYLFLTELVYILLVLFPHQVSEVLFQMELVAPDNSLVKAYVENSALFSVIILTGVADSFAFIKKFEQKIRRKLHNRAFIPEEAKDAVKFFQNNPSAFRPDPKIIRRVLKKINSPLYSEIDFDYTENQDGETLSHKWCKLSYLRFRLKEKDIRTRSCIPISGSEPRFTAFINKIKESAKDIKEYHALKGKGDSPEIAVLKQALIRRIDEMLSTAYEFIGCHILATAKMPHQRNLAYKYFGLHLNRSRISPVDWDTIAFSLFCIFLATVGPGLGYFFLAGAMGHESKILKVDDPFTPIMAAVISVFMNGLTIVAVAMAQRRNAKKTEALYGASGIALPKNRVLGTIFSAGWGFAAGVTLLILNDLFLNNLSLLSALTPSWDWLWGCGPATTGAFIYYYLESALTAYRKRGRESLIQGTVTASIMTVVSIFAMGGKIGSEAPFYAYTVVTAFAIGAAIGYVFPEGYRRMKKRRMRRHERIKINIPVIVKVNGVEHPCKTRDISLGGTGLNVTLDAKIGDTAEVVLPESLILPAKIINKKEKKGFLRRHLTFSKNQFSLKFEIKGDRKRSKQLQAFIDDLQFACAT